MTAPLWTAAEIAAATGGTAAGRWDAAGVSIDTRTLRPGDLFVALKGPSFDGHAFVAAALKAGAAGALVHTAGAGTVSDGSHDRLVLVKDTFAGLQDLGRAARARADARIVAVTGSVGKTGTKEGLRVALAAQGPTAATAGNLNNHWGVPLSLARMPRESRFGVFELGMNHPGEIAPLSRLVRPHVAVITAVEAVHLEFFDSVAGIAREKASIMAGLEPGGIAVLPRDSAQFDVLAAEARRYGARVMTFGSDDGTSDALLVSWALTPAGTQVAADIAGHRHTYEIGASGRHWAVNSVAVLAAVLALGGDVGLAAAAFARLRAPEGRGVQRIVEGPRGGFTLIDESYNASPASVRATAETLGAMAGTGRRILALGDMLELGETAGELHAGLAPSLQAAGIDLVFTAGPLMARLHDALPPAMRGGHAGDAAALAPLVAAAVRGGDAVAVKGSHGSRMALVVDALAALDAAPRRANGH
jgi:UDP-N-acetylmuramoyl-tripeptide--D-alanyl-D-alanine ligase